MIEINLLPGATKKTRSGVAALNIKDFASGLTAKVRDPYLIAAVVSMFAAMGAVGWMHLGLGTKVEEMATRESQAVRDSTRYALIINDRRTALAKRDSVVKQLNIIKSIDNDRYVWPHILDEVSRSLPPYTWLKSIQQTSGVAAPAAAPGDSAAKGALPVSDVIKFRLIGNTVDIQALTRFMKLLETSPFIEHVNLAKSEVVMIEGKEVTEFQLDADFERPDRSVITTAPVSLSVR